MRNGYAPKWHHRYRVVDAIVLTTMVTAIMPASFAFAQYFRIADPIPPHGAKAPHEWGPMSHWDLREFPSCVVPWTLGTGPIPYFTNPPTEPVNRAFLTSKFKEAFDRWDAVTPSELSFQNVPPAGATPAGGFFLDDWNTLSFADSTVIPFELDATTAVWASATTGRIFEADIVFNINQITDYVSGGIEFGHREWRFLAHGTRLDVDFNYPSFDNWPWAPDGDTDNYNDHWPQNEMDLGAEAMHEIGHFIGLDDLGPIGGHRNEVNSPIMGAIRELDIGPGDGGWVNLELQFEDQDAVNFLYCPDLGDAPDPCVAEFNVFPTLVHDPDPGRTLNGIILNSIGVGAEHLFGTKEGPLRNWTYEWLAIQPGGDVDSECEANVVDKDPFDDGVTWYPNPPIWGRPVTVEEWIKYASDNIGNGHDYAAHAIYGNAWMDINQNCIWEEHFLHKKLQPPTPTGINTVRLRHARGTIGLPRSVNPALPVWLRCRVDWGEDVGAVAKIDFFTLDGPAGAAQHGEVEDYPFLCTTRYETIRFCNPFPFPIPGFAMVVVGPSEVVDQTYSAVVDQNACVLSVGSPPSTAYVTTTDETVVDFPVPGWLPPNTYGTFSRCRPNNPPRPAHTTARASLVTPEVPATTPAVFVPTDLRVPTVNCAYRVYTQDEANYGQILFTVGAVDFANGGWIDGPDTVTTEWDDTLRVTVSYRVAPNVIPIENLSPCDPAYNQYPLHPVGQGLVTPRDAFEFLLDAPDDVPPGHHVILEVQTAWSTNVIVTNQIVEFPDPIGTSTSVGDPPLPRTLALENYPNPFNPSTTIRYALPHAGPVTLEVFDVSGRLIRTLMQEHKPAGVFLVEWDGTDASHQRVASGVYFYRLTTASETVTRKMVLLK